MGGRGLGGTKEVASGDMKPVGGRQGTEGKKERRNKVRTLVFRGPFETLSLSL